MPACGERGAVGLDRGGDLRPVVVPAPGVQVRRDVRLRDAVRHRDARHLERLLERLRPVVDARQQVAVEVDHK